MLDLYRKMDAIDQNLQPKQRHANDFLYAAHERGHEGSWTFCGNVTVRHPSNFVVK